MRSRKGLGFVCGFFFGVLGLLGLLACNDSDEKNTFMSGWIGAFIINIAIVIIAVTLIIGAVADAYQYRYY
ncbi:MAG: hypothetical protein SPL13_03105 [Clostridia bacterium]|nr:hypothetical protein [Clostridia bacterium]